MQVKNNINIFKFFIFINFLLLILKKKIYIKQITAFELKKRTNIQMKKKLSYFKQLFIQFIKNNVIKQDDLIRSCIK